MGSKAFILLILAAYGFLFWVVYLLIARPLQYVEWFLRRTYRSWGISMTVDDESKLKRRTRVWGLLLLVSGIVHATLMMGSILRCR
ncbi:MAG: hypothetical protein HYZ91_01395 [Candidatus Omnitrophica bacterium]|nr:hypothetical protein [Candidatus Omnitrophota bacterium]